jgi:hypothetical protein
MAAPSAPPSYSAETATTDAAGSDEALDDAATAPSVSAEPPQPPLGLPLLAYRYSYGLEAPARALPGLLRRHEAACVSAGPATCQVIGASTATMGEDEVRGRLEIRARADWLQRFRGGLEADAKRADGRVSHTSVETEDLTRAIVDTEAQLRAKAALRTRLENLLASRPGKLAELLEVERELARVQGEIDSAQSQLSVMRARVLMSKLEIAYASEGRAVTDATLNPLAAAFRDFAGIVAMVLAAMVRVVAFLLPLLLVLVPLAWLIRHGRRRGWLKREPRRPSRAAVLGSAPEDPPAP